MENSIYLTFFNMVIKYKPVLKAQPEQPEISQLLIFSF
jgi:hypothetical protein